MLKVSLISESVLAVSDGVFRAEAVEESGAKIVDAVGLESRV